MQRTPTRFLLKVLLQNEAEICEKKIQGNVFLLNQRPHAKFQLIWMTFKKWPKSSLTPFFHGALQLLDLQ